MVSTILYKPMELQGGEVGLERHTDPIIIIKKNTKGYDMITDVI